MLLTVCALVLNVWSWESELDALHICVASMLLYERPTFVTVTPAPVYPLPESAGVWGARFTLSTL